MKWYLDFGHGGKDPGAIGPTNLKESDVALKIGMIIKENLENELEKVITTREDDKYYSLDYRTKKANNENCDYFISIHLNSATNSSAKGCEVWLYNENSKLKNLANNLCNNLSTKMDTPNRGVKDYKNLSVLKNTKMPALLIDIDFISNKTYILPFYRQLAYAALAPFSRISFRSAATLASRPSIWVRS